MEAEGNLETFLAEQELQCSNFGFFVYKKVQVYLC